MGFQTIDRKYVTLILQTLCNLSGVRNNQASLVEGGGARTLSKIAASPKTSLECKQMCGECC